MEEKKEIRKKIFKARKEHTDAWIRENSLRITEALTQLPEYRNAERIMAYADYNHEVITRYIIEQAWKDGKEVSTLKDICEAVPIPAVAIGGLNAGNMDVLEGAGMSGMAVVSAIMKAEDPKKNARELKEKIVALMGK